MFPRYVIGLFIGAVAIGWMMPSGQSEPEPVAEQQSGKDAAFENIDADEISAEFYEPEDVVLKRERDGHFYANADVDGAELRFLIDTGASGIALTGADADALGIIWDEDDLQKVGRGVSGDVYGKPVMLKSVQVGRFIVEDVQAAVIPNGLDVSLLGQSFLSKIGNVNIQENQMTLK